MAWILVIDFGTSYTVAAAKQTGRSPEVIEIGGERRVPSVIGVEADGHIVTGRAAEDRSGSNPGGTLRAPKTRLGDQAPVVLSGRSFSIVELIGALLRDIYDQAVMQMESAPDEVRLTHPATWNRPRLNRLLEAATRAGLPDCSLVPEPVAAALAYAIEAGFTDGANIAVYDLGGGTFDTAVLSGSIGRFTIKGRPGGDQTIGGDLFDELLYNMVGGQLPAETWNSIVIETDAQWRSVAEGFRREIRAAKERLSTSASTNVSVALPAGLFQYGLQRTEFEELVRPYLEETTMLLQRCLVEAGVTPAELAVIYLVGGASRSPIVEATVKAAFPTVRVSRRGDPKTAVALGASLAARGGTPTDPGLRPPASPTPLGIPPLAAPISTPPVAPLAAPISSPPAAPVPTSPRPPAPTPPPVAPVLAPTAPVLPHAAPSPAAGSPVPPPPAPAAPWQPAVPAAVAASPRAVPPTTGAASRPANAARPAQPKSGGIRSWSARTRWIATAVVVVVVAAVVAVFALGGNDSKSASKVTAPTALATSTTSVAASTTAAPTTVAATEPATTLAPTTVPSTTTADTAPPASSPPATEAPTTVPSNVVAIADGVGIPQPDGWTGTKGADGSVSITDATSMIVVQVLQRQAGEDPSALLDAYIGNIDASANAVAYSPVTFVTTIAGAMSINEYAVFYNTFDPTNGLGAGGRVLVFQRNDGLTVIEDQSGTDDLTDAQFATFTTTILTAPAIGATISTPPVATFRLKSAHQYVEVLGNLGFYTAPGFTIAVQGNNYAETSNATDNFAVARITRQASIDAAMQQADTSLSTDNTNIVFGGVQNYDADANGIMTDKVTWTGQRGGANVTGEITVYYDPNTKNAVIVLERWLTQPDGSRPDVPESTFMNRSIYISFT
ncbi:MAG TPA: Hsp70 family protein, partial [Ilumatobacteraceae bacterium]